MGIDNERKLAKCSTFEAEMRRRLWWSLIIFDNRMCEMSHYASSSLTPIWDCRVPMNVNDTDLRPDTKSAPMPYERPTEAIFVFLRSRLNDCVRFSRFHLDLTNPRLKPLARLVPNGSGAESEAIDELSHLVEGNYLKLCDPDNALHFVTIWSTRSFLARLRLLEYYASTYRSIDFLTDVQRDSAALYAISMIECDTELMTAPHARRFAWWAHAYFPAPAYIHIVQDLKKRPSQAHNQRCWDAMSQNYDVRFKREHPGINPFFKIMTKIILQAWAAREAVYSGRGEQIETPTIVSDIQEKTLLLNSSEDVTLPRPYLDGLNKASSSDEYRSDTTSRLGMQQGDSAPLDECGCIFGQATMAADWTQFDWDTMDWNDLLATNVVSPPPGQWQ